MKNVVILVLIVMLFATSFLGCSNEKDTDGEINNTTTSVSTTAVDDFTETEETDLATGYAYVAFLLNDYIYYYDDAYLVADEDCDPFPFNISYDSLYRTDKNGNGREKIYSGKDIAVYRFGLDYSDGEYMYIVENIKSEKSKKISKISVNTGECTPFFEDILNDKNTVFPYAIGFEIYNDGLFYLKKNDAKSESTQTELWYASADGKTDFICDGVQGYYLVGNRLYVNTSHGAKAFKAYPPYKETYDFLFEMELPEATDNTGVFVVNLRFNEDSGKSELYKCDYGSEEETLLKTGYISNCTIANDIIFFTEYKNNKCTVYQMDLNGENIKQLS